MTTTDLFSAALATSQEEAKVRLCLVVPCYNEEDMLPIFFETVIPYLDAATAGMWQIVCVDDGSKDKTFQLIAQQRLMEDRIIGVRLSRNFGHQAAVSIGLAFARGMYVGVIDCDLQDPVEVLIELYQTAQLKDLDVCYGVRAHRDAPLFLRLAYSWFYRIIEHMADHAWPKDAGDFCVMSSRCHRVLLSLPEQSRMMRGLRAWIGFNQAGVPYHRPARRQGTSKYSISKLCALALQGLVAFSSIPLRLASIIGITMAGTSTLGGFLILLNRLFPKFSLLGYWVGGNQGLATVLIFGAFLSSILFLCFGIIGEYLVVMFQEIKRRPTAVVESVLGTVESLPVAYSLVYLPEAFQERSVHQ